MRFLISLVMALVVTSISEGAVIKSRTVVRGGRQAVVAPVVVGHSNFALRQRAIVLPQQRVYFQQPQAIIIQQPQPLIIQQPQAIIQQPAFQSSFQFFSTGY